MMRWILRLACDHNLMADHDVPIGTVEYCPGCGHNFEVVETFKHRDDDLTHLCTHPRDQREPNGDGWDTTYCKVCDETLTNTELVEQDSVDV